MGLIGVCIFSCIISYWECVSIAQEGLRYRRIGAGKCLRHNGFSLRFRYSKGIVFATGKADFYSSTPEVEVARTSSRVSTFWVKKLLRCNHILPQFRGNEGIVFPFAKRFPDVDRIAFSAFRTRFSASEYTLPPLPKVKEKVIAPQRLFML